MACTSSTTTRQILDPSRFDSSDDPPGGVYGVDPPTGGYINRANKTGEWNTLVIEFRPPSLDPSDRKVIRRAARIKTVLNGHVVFDGAFADSTVSTGLIDPGR